MNRSPIFGYLALYQNLLITETGNCRDKGEIWRNKRRKADGAGAEGSSAPARDCGLREGDIITHINREEVDSIEEVQSVLQEVGGKPMSIRAVRDDKTVQLTAQAVQCGSDGQYKLGAWIRDSMAGIGTLTFCEPATGRFGALGHGINDVDTAQLMPLQSGSIMYSEVTDVKKGEKGARFR